MDQQNPATPQPQPDQHQAQTTTAATEPKRDTRIAATAYVLFFVPLLTNAKNNPFVKFHVKQGLILAIACFVSTVLMKLPTIGSILTAPLNIFLVILWILGVINALTGKQKHLPLIGKYGDKFNF